MLEYIGPVPSNNCVISRQNLCEQSSREKLFSSNVTRTVPKRLGFRLGRVWKKNWISCQWKTLQSEKIWNTRQQRRNEERDSTFPPNFLPLSLLFYPLLLLSLLTTILSFGIVDHVELNEGIRKFSTRFL